MKSKGMEIVRGNVKEIVTLLNHALADEWLAYYQYWIGAKVVKGITSPFAIKEFEEHAEEELKHANMLADRILQLGGVPLLSPEEWIKKSQCGYLPPNDEKVKKILEQNIQAEQCAIKTYDAIARKIKERDLLTFNMIMEILKDEIEHEYDLSVLLEDLQRS